MNFAVSQNETLNFDLLVGHRTTAGYSLTIVRSPAGEGTTLCHVNPALAAQSMRHALTASASDDACLIEFGRQLFAKLFTGEIGALYRASTGIARGQQARLQIRLRLEAPELAALPWEYLYDAQENSFLALSAETAFVRYVPMNVPSRPPQSDSPCGY
jgi:hypothetical protein